MWTKCDHDGPVTASHRCTDPSGDGFRQLLGRELTRFCAGRGQLIVLCTAAVLFVLVAILSSTMSRAANPPIPTGPGGEAVTDTYMLVHQTLVGDGSLTARVASLSGSHTSQPPTSNNASSAGPAAPQFFLGLSPWAKAGLILEPDTHQGTEYAASIVTGSHGVRMQYNYIHDTAGMAGDVGPSSPRWLRLSRAGDLVRAYDSIDGVSWTETGAARLAGLPRTAQLGLFVTSPDYFSARSRVGTPTVATTRFDHISTAGDLPRRSWTADPVGGVAPNLSSGPTWQQLSADAVTVSGSGDIAPLVGGQGPATHWSGASTVNGTIVALLIVIGLAALYATSEHRRGPGGRAAVAATRPGLEVVAKAVVAASMVFVAGSVAAAIAEVVTRHIFAANGNYLFPQSVPVTLRVDIGTGLFLALAAALVDRACHHGSQRRHGRRPRRGAAGAAWRGRHDPPEHRALAHEAHPNRGLRHPGHPAPLQPSTRRVHDRQRLLPDQPMGWTRRARRLHDGRPERSHLARPPPPRNKAPKPVTHPPLTWTPLPLTVQGARLRRARGL